MRLHILRSKPWKVVESIPASNRKIAPMSKRRQMLSGSVHWSRKSVSIRSMRDRSTHLVKPLPLPSRYAGQFNPGSGYPDFVVVLIGSSKLHGPLNKIKESLAASALCIKTI